MGVSRYGYPGDIHSIFLQIILKLCINLIQHILFAAGHIQWRNLFSVRNSFFHQPFHIERTVNQTFHFFRIARRHDCAGEGTNRCKPFRIGKAVQQCAVTTHR